MAPEWFLHHGPLQAQGMEKHSSIPAHTRGALGGSRPTGALRTPQENKASRGVSAPCGYDQPQAFGEMGCYVTQRREHCTAALAASIFSVIQAAWSLWDLAASSSVAEVGEKWQRGMPRAAPVSHPPAPRQALTHQWVLLGGVVHGEIVLGLL